MCGEGQYQGHHILQGDREARKEESHSRDTSKEELGTQLGTHCRRKSQGQCLETSSISTKSWVPILRQYDNVNFCYSSGVFSKFCRRKPSEVLTNIRETHDEFSDRDSLVEYFRLQRQFGIEAAGIEPSKNKNMDNIAISGIHCEMRFL